MVETIDMIHEQYSERLYKNAFTDLRGQLEENRDELFDKALSEEHLLQEIHQKLEEECGTFKDLIPHTISFNHISPGIKKVYKQAHTAFNKLKGSSRFEDFHELQKRVNYLQDQLEIINPIWPRMMDAWEEELDTLNDILIAHEGLFHLSEYLAKNGDTDTSEDGTHLMATLIHGHSEQLQAHSQLLAKRIFYLKPKDFIHYIEKLWQAHQQQNEKQLLPLEKLGFDA